MSIIGNFPVSSSDEEQTAAAVAAHNNSKDAHEDIRTLAAAAATKQDKLTGKKGQVVGFSDTGTAVAQDNIPTVEMTQEGYDALSETEKQSAALYVVHDGQSSGGAAPSAHAGGGSASDGIIIKYKGKSISAGSSPYEYAVAGGYKGTEEEFQALMGNGPWVPSTGRLLSNNNEVFNDLDANSAHGRDNHAEGSGCNISGCGASHIEGSANNAHIYDANGTQEVIMDSGIHVEGIGNDVQSYDSFSFGIHVEGQFNVLKSSTSGSYEDVSEISGTHVEGISNEVYGASHSHVEGRRNRLSAVSDSSLIPSVYSCHIGGESNVVVAHSVDGYSCIMSNLYIGGYSNNVDIYNETFENSFVYGGYSKVIGEIGIKNLCLFGYDNEVSSPTDGSATLIGDSIFISGHQNKISAEATSKWLTNGLTIVGHLNNDKQTDGLFIVGNGTASGPGTYNRSNCFRVTDTQVFGGTYKSTGADYAELFEWLDGNPNGEDRAGRFVTLDGDKLRLATPEDDFILGIVSGNPSIVGDVHDDQWHGMYQQDIFGRYIWEDVEIPEETEEKPDPKSPGKTITVVKRPAHTERRRVVNPDYDPDQKYTPRSERPEWDAVGMIGKLVAVDDGSCQAGGYCSVGSDGAATHSAQRTGWRVMKRLDETHVLLLAL